MKKAADYLIYLFILWEELVLKKWSQTVLLVIVVYFLNLIHFSFKCIIKIFYNIKCSQMYNY